MEERIYRVDVEEGGEGRSRLRFSGRLDFRETFESWEDVQELLDVDARAFDLDLSAVESIDGGSAALLIQLKNEILQRDCGARIVGAQGSVRSLLALYGEHAQEPSLKSPPRERGLVEYVGTSSAALGKVLETVFDFIGDMVVDACRAVRRPRTVHWPEMFRVMERAGPDAIPIVMLVNFLVGVIMALQAAEQLRRYGADLFVADLVGISVTRELGPLMTAIILAGRSGAAFAAEVGTMKVSEEVDALRTLGFSAYRFLVFPRVLAMMVIFPLLTALADAVGIAGGLLVGITHMDLTVISYLTETSRALSPWDVGSGLLKSLFFAGAVALIGCERGLAARGGAAGVGRTTTSAVVAMIFHLVALDAAFTVLFNALRS